MIRATHLRVLLCTTVLATFASAGSATGKEPEQVSELETIVVTAQKRSENLQDAPVTVQAITESMLKTTGVSGTRDLATLVSGLTTGKNLSAGTPYLRGIGQNTGGIGVESPVAVYIDGVYLVAPASGLFSFNNVQQIEVDKGPQGTLFGRNTTGGVIQVVTKQPSATPAFKASVGYGNYNTFSGDVYATGRIADNLVSSISAFGLTRQDGFIDNPFLHRTEGQEDDYGVQSKTLWTPGESTDVTLNLIYSSQYGYVGSTNGVYPGMVADDHVTRFGGNYTVFDGILTRNRDAQALTALTANHDLAWARLTSITAYHWLWDGINGDTNAEPLHTPFLPRVGTQTNYLYGYQNTLTQEFQIKSPDSQDLRWIGGLYYLSDRTRINLYTPLENQFIIQGGSPSISKPRQKTTSYAPFAEASKTVLPDTRLTLGVRWTRDEKSLDGTIQTLLPSGAFATSTPQAPGAGLKPIKTPKSWEDFTYRAVLDHHFTPDIMGYASFNRGFKSGLYNLFSFANPPVDPETVDAYEVGLKNELFEHRLRLNLSGFYYNYQNIQLRETSNQFPGRFVLLNAANSDVKGIDVDFTAVPVHNLTLTGGLEFLDAHYTQFPGAPFATPNPVNLPLRAGCKLLGPALPPAAAFLGGNTTVACNGSGNEMIRSPRFTGNIGAAYDYGLASGSTLRFVVNDHYNSGFFWDVDNLLTQRPTHNVAASVTWTAPSDQWDVSLWGTNLAQANIWANATAGITSLYAPGEPRLFGIRVSVRR